MASLLLDDSRRGAVGLDRLDAVLHRCVAGVHLAPADGLTVTCLEHKIRAAILGDLALEHVVFL